MTPGADPPFTVPVPRGYRVGPWEVREPIASGAFGSVYAARLRGGANDGRPGAPAPDGPRTAELPCTAALKFLPTGTRTPRQLNHLRELAHREVDLLGRLRLPRLIRMYQTLVVDDPEHPELDGATVLVLERAEGSLDSLLEADPQPGNGPELLAQVCSGLDQLHQAGWVHGDLKPANVLLLRDGTVRLADFNLSAELEGTHAYAPGFASPDYTPPELLWSQIGVRGQRIRPTADVWAFGVLAHLVLTGSMPFPGGTTEARRDAVVRYARHGEPPRLSPALPEDWRAIITDCLARTHQERAAHRSTVLLRRVERAAGTPRSGRSWRLRPGAGRALRPRLRAVPREGLRPWWGRPVPALGAVVALGVALGSYALPDRKPEVRYGYHHCPEDSVCFFSQPNGMGEMCAWSGDDPDWLSGEETCEWTRHLPVKSVFNSRWDGPGAGGVAYYRGRDYAPSGFDRIRDSKRTGCTTARSQGNLAGTYAPLSHRWVDHC